jgi:hypothetical protein
MGLRASHIQVVRIRSLPAFFLILFLSARKHSGGGIGEKRKTMDTTIFNNPAMNGCGAQCMDIVTAGLISLASVAVLIIAGVYCFAGICKRVR